MLEISHYCFYVSMRFNVLRDTFFLLFLLTVRCSRAWVSHKILLLQIFHLYHFDMATNVMKRRWQKKLFISNENWLNFIVSVAFLYLCYRCFEHSRLGVWRSLQIYQNWLCLFVILYCTPLLIRFFMELFLSPVILDSADFIYVYLFFLECHV